ncbi:hypothetical protein [Sandaracinus amylolyticus]|uniref:hypothetical protein n=1 Tax=Sandaracinus amylolyticus TaxID=927083 RepID=UPI001F3F6848|nr:hypothetical protein [Sandaracinus amylolyticus]UJR86125.1 Hypothetical protein I5071_82060 [Sandaracinus amylolyticus]
MAPFLVALALRLALAVAFPVRPVWDGVIYERAADAIARGEGYTRGSIDPDASDADEATAFYPVGFSAMIAPLRWVRAAPALDLVAQSCAGALIVIGAGLLGRRAGGARTGRRAAWLVALWPGGILLSASWLSEPFFALFVCAASLVIVYARRRHALRATALAALILGVGAYVRPTSIPMLALMTIGVALVSSRDVVGRARALVMHGAVAAIVVALVLAPWALRNASALDGAALTSTNGGANLLVGTRGEGGYATLEPDDDGDCGGLGEVARDRCLADLATARITEDPLAWLARGVLKITSTFGHESSPAQAWGEATQRAGVSGEAHALWALGIERAWWLVFLAGVIAGGVILARRSGDGRVKVALFAPLLGLAALHFVFLGGDRYHAPVVPLMAALCALAITAARRPAR